MQRGTTHLWRVTPLSGAVEPAGALPFWGRNLQIGPDGRLAFLSPEGGIFVIDLASSTLTRTALPGPTPRALAAISADDKIVALSRRARGSIVILYQLGRVTAPERR